MGHVEWRGGIEGSKPWWFSLCSMGIEGGGEGVILACLGRSSSDMQICVTLLARVITNMHSWVLACMKHTRV
jgi:hypothetical protein